ncbi:MAG: histidinol-phosphatase [Clostridia bacterium]|nr:histidinol-phosphatase [Clostridia bacterium]
MNVKSNFHTHTTYCDGKNTPEEMIKSAIEKGFTHLGFSGHAYTSFDLSWCMSKEKTKEYKNEILRLKDKYKNEISIYLGLEMDYYSEENLADYDYIIGSVHYVEKNGVYYPVDESEEILLNAVNDAWNGDIYAFIDDYYSLVKNLPKRFDFDIVGHIDLVTKFNESGNLFDENCDKYKNSAYCAIDELLSYHKSFEVNTGAIIRGYRTKPYPSDMLLTRIKEGNGRVIISADAHSVDGLDFAFDKAQEIIDSLKIKQIKVL